MKRGMVVGDLHCGSIYGLLPDVFETYDGVVKPQNAGQEYLWKCWDDFTWRAHNYQPEFVIVNGDCVEGPQRKQNGFEIALPSMDDQIQAAVKTLELLKARVPKARWFFTRGTPYHVGEWGGVEEVIATLSGGEAYPSLGVGKRC